MSTPVTAEMSAKLTEWRMKTDDGTISLEEMKIAIRSLRAGRLAAATSSEAATRSRAKREIKSADDLLDELGGLS